MGNLAKNGFEGLGVKHSAVHEDTAFEWGKTMMGMNLVLDMASGHPKLTVSNKALGLERELASLEMKPCD